MQIFVVGCGRVGAAVIEQLVEAGQDIIVVEKDAQQLTRIEHIECQKVLGIPIDHKVLADAGIEYCDAFIGLSDNENINAMAAGVALRFFKVPTCVIRVFNPLNVAMYQAQGFGTISQTELVMDRVLDTLGFVATDERVTLLGQSLRFSVIEAEHHMVGHTVGDLLTRHAIRIFARVRPSDLELMDPTSVIVKGDRLVVVEKN